MFFPQPQINADERRYGNGVMRRNANAQPLAPPIDRWRGFGYNPATMSQARETTVRRYPVLLEYDTDYDGFVVEVPDLPGCVSQGKSEAEALSNIREAIELYIETLREDGDPVPPPRTTRLVEVAG